MIYSCGIIVNMGLILIETKILMSINSSISSQSQTTIPAAALVAAPAECQLKNGLSIQTKLSIDAIDDPLEHEADAVADQVMRMPETNFIQRKCDHCKAEENILRKPYSSSFVLFFKRHMVTQANPISHIISQLTSVSTMHVQPAEILTHQQCISYV